MNEMHVYGASDDLIEIDGDVSEEFYANFSEPTEMMVGLTKLSIEYTTEGVWSIIVENEAPSDEVTIYDVGSGEAEQYKDYSQLAVVKSPTDEVTKLD